MCNIDSVYIHVPYCKSKCNYCAFYSVVSGRYGDYEKSVIREWKLYKKDYDFSRVKTVYIGGGTPSLLNCSSLSKIISAVKSDLTEEITVEVNPGTVDIDKLKCLKDSGVNRLSIGFQSLDDRVLSFLGRTHGVKENFDTFGNARKAGFDNISIDIIIGIPGYTDTVKNTIIALTGLKPEHVSAYILSIEEKTRFYRLKESGLLSIPKENEVRENYLTVCSVLAENGYGHYEISNFALPEMESKHNLTYWKGGAYIGLGPSASGYNGSLRYTNVSNIKKYEKMLAKDILPVEYIEKLTDKERINEFIFLNLRLKEGLDLNRLKSEFGADLVGQKGEKLHDFGEKGLIRRVGENLRLTEEGYLLSDTIFAELMI